MSEKNLSNFETFEEIPDGVLLVKKNTNLMYIKIGECAFVAREFVDCVSNVGNNLIHDLSYYDVSNNEKVLSIKLIKSLVDSEAYCLSENLDIQIIPLSRILNIKDNSKYYLNIDDINSLINFKKEESKEKRKYYF